MTPLDKMSAALALSQSGEDCFSALLPEAQEALRENVRAVLGAIREPTDRMIMAGISERHDQPCPEAWSLATENIWRQMVDTALTDQS